VLVAYELAEAREAVMTGMVTGCRPYSAGWEADLAIGAEAITRRLGDD
jgi:hypothetical protein